jgi:3-deoxy-7-phosphoheptulonate synthase
MQEAVVDPLAGWSPSSWQKCTILQQPEFADQSKLKKALDKVHALPPLVHPKEVEALKSHLAAACEGKKFLLQVVLIYFPF